MLGEDKKTMREILNHQGHSVITGSPNLEASSIIVANVIMAVKPFTSKGWSWLPPETLDTQAQRVGRGRVHPKEPSHRWLNIATAVGKM